MQDEFTEFDRSDSWDDVLEEVDEQAYYANRNQSQQAAKLNMCDNRYCNVLPFDDHRVKLSDESSDYINASLVKVAAANREYIVSQGPLDHTAGRFWLMIWQKKCPGIVMLTKLYHGDMVICDLYYPDEVACGEDNVVKFQSEGLTLALMSKETSSNGYILRKFKLTDVKVWILSKFNLSHHCFLLFKMWTNFSFKYIEIIARNGYSKSLVI
ncbi:PTPN1 [Bugula neritina]|uniref:protein-tyrosine-phosphatase n=1 Tax=Bugula neritina TaxID=10212 RepID=A0A7J7JBM7_BUGNE|nr:PTPN1 [Bugula neritina]